MARRFVQAEYLQPGDVVVTNEGLKFTVTTMTVGDKSIGVVGEYPASNRMVEIVRIYDVGAEVFVYQTAEPSVES